MNWKANQSQAGAMLDRDIKSSNLFGKLGDWLGNIFIFDSIGIAAFIVGFLFLVFGFQILKNLTSKSGKQFHILFSLFVGCLFLWAQLPKETEL
jgi:S-DNA-T family DNA segregation ATPase FtsK/SpoIIIE